jgi:hypothetical protein
MNSEMKNSLSVSADGEVLKCAKGAEVSECGFTPGAKVCAKCGALPIQVKMVPVNDEEGMEEELEEEMEEDFEADMEKGMEAMEGAGPDAMPRRRVLPMQDDMMEDDMEEEDEDSMDEEKSSYLKKFGPKRYMKRYGKKPWMPEEELEQKMSEMIEDEEDEEDEDEDLTDAEKALLWTINKKRKARGLAATTNGFSKKEMEEDLEDDEEEEILDTEDDEDDDLTDEEKALLWTVNQKRKKRGLTATTNGFAKKMMLEEESMIEDEDMADEEAEKKLMLERMRKKRIASMGMKSEDLGPRGYVCAIERKAYSAKSSVCDDCPGGCISEKGLPGLLHVEGLAEQMFNGKVLDSGYSAKADMYVIDVQVKSGAVNEVFVDGTTAEVMGFHRLDNSVFEQKSYNNGPMSMIQFHEAADIAVKAIDGHVIGVEPDSFEGIDSYAVEIDGFDGKSYDVFVSLDGEVLGYDKYEMDEAEEIEAEAAEIALKRAFTDDQRTSMAKEGMAMPDGSFPIKSESDLRNAIQAFGRAKDKEAAKRHIMKRAKDMGKEDLIPANWVMGGGTEKKSDSIDSSLMASLIEFELLQAETEIN